VVEEGLEAQRRGPLISLWESPGGWAESQSGATSRKNYWPLVRKLCL
jgi:hypothetical protein